MVLGEDAFEVGRMWWVDWEAVAGCVEGRASDVVGVADTTAFV